MWAIFPLPSLLKGLTEFFMWPLPRGRCCLNLPLLVHITASPQGTFLSPGDIEAM